MTGGRMLSCGAAAARFETESGRGLSLSFDDGVWTNRCVALVDRDGGLTCWSGRTRPGEPFEPAAAVDGGGDARADSSWAYAAFGAAPVRHLMDRLGMPHEGRGEAGHSLAAELAGEAGWTGADARGLDAMRRAPTRRASALAFYSGDGDRAERRRQAALAYPVLADVLASGLATKMAIDRSRPLADPVAQAVAGMSGQESAGKALVRRLAAAPDLPEGCSLETAARFMALVPADWIPVSPGDEWTAFCSCARAFLEDLETPEDRVAGMLSGCGGRWAEFSARIARKAGLEDGEPGENVRRAMRGAAGMARTFSEVAILPLAAHAGESGEVTVTSEMRRHARSAALSALFGGRNAADVADLQRRFHQEREAVLGEVGILEEERNAAIRAGIADGGWPMMTQPVQAPNGLWLVPLATPSELEWEGLRGVDPTGAEGLYHCVGGYSRSASTCSSFIVSVRQVDPDGSYRRLSTAEFGPLPGEGEPTAVRQHFGKDNSTPAPEARDALAWYRASIEARTVPLNREQVEAFIAGAYIPDDGVERLCGYDWRDRDMLNAAVAPWGPFVSKAWRGAGLDRTMDRPEVAAITQMIPPDIMLAPAGGP